MKQGGTVPQHPDKVNLKVPHEQIPRYWRYGTEKQWDCGGT